MPKNRMLIFCGYGITLILLLYFGINGLISTVLSDTFPNARFFIIFTLIIIVAWFIGLRIRKYLNGFNDDTRNKIRNSFVGITAFSWMKYWSKKSKTLFFAGFIAVSGLIYFGLSVKFF